MRGMTWLVLRQHRAALWTFGAVFAAIAAYIVWQRVAMQGYVHDQGIQGCWAFDTVCHGKRLSEENGPRSPLDHLDRTYRDPMLTTGRLLLALPVVIGAFVGGPLLAREWENRTYKLVWSQSVGRVRWTVVTLALPAALTALGTAVLAALYTWWWWPARDLFGDVSWGTTVPFHAAGPLLPALALVSFFLGAATGMLVRRMLPAVVITSALATGAQLALARVRPRLLPLRTLTFVDDDNMRALRGAWRHSDPMWDRGMLTRTGEKLPSGRCLPAHDELSRSCLKRHGALTNTSYEEVHPIGQYWPMQWIEAGICLVAAVALGAFCLWWVGREGRTGG